MFFINGHRSAIPRNIVYGVVCLLIILDCGMALSALAQQPPIEQKIEQKVKPHSERVVWDKRPITIALVVGHERMLHFPEAVRYWLPSVLEDAVSILSIDGVVYLTALRSFDPARMRVQGLTSQRVYLIDVNAVVDGEVSVSVIVTDPEFTGGNVVDVRDQEHSDPYGSQLPAATQSLKKPAGDWYVRLTRFAAQSLYAPERLSPEDGEIVPQRLPRYDALPLIRGGFIEALPLESWRGGGLTVTAVRLRNLSHESVQIVHEASLAERMMARLLVLRDDVRGRWLALTPQHTTLAPTGSPDAMTTLYLISGRSFIESWPHGEHE